MYCLTDPHKSTEYAVELPGDLAQRLAKANEAFEAVQREVREFLDNVPNLQIYPFKNQPR